MRPGRSRRDRSVFLNIPFDREYEDCFLALIASLVGLGLLPRSVLEVPPSRDRLRRIYQLIKNCRYSLHDLSRVEPAEGVFPRFNMPFEAGLASALALERRRHDRFLLESQPFRLQRTCSDLNGTDAEIHGGTAAGSVRCVRNLFGHVQPVDAADLLLIHERLQLAAQRIKTQAGPLGIFTADCFRALVSTARAVDDEVRAARRVTRLSRRKQVRA